MLCNTCSEGNWREKGGGMPGRVIGSGRIIKGFSDVEWL